MRRKVIPRAPQGARSCDFFITIKFIAKKTCFNSTQLGSVSLELCAVDPSSEWERGGI